jgi:hypothetical protein
MSTPNKRRRIIIDEEDDTMAEPVASSVRDATKDEAKPNLVEPSSSPPDGQQQQHESSSENPTPEGISKVLCIVEGSHHDHAAKLRGLKTLKKWLGSHDTDVVETFVDFGGIPRLLTFLKRNMSNAACAKHVGYVLTECTYCEKDDEDLAMANAMQIVRYDGLRLLLLTTDEYDGGTDEEQLDSLDSIWLAVQNLSYFDNTLLSKDQKVQILDSALDTLEKLRSVYGPTVSTCISRIFFAVGNNLNDPRLITYDFDGKNVAGKCITALQKSDGEWRTGSDFVRGALYSFGRLIIKGGLTEKESVEVLVRFVVKQLKDFPAETLGMGGTSKILEAAFELVGGRFIERSGVLGALGKILESDDTDGATLQNARAVHKELGALLAP